MLIYSLDRAQAADASDRSQRHVTTPEIWRIRLYVFARHLVILTAMNLVWEFAQMPLYRLWYTGSAGEILYAGLHCTAGDAMIGGSALLAALLLFRPSRWPWGGQDRVLAASVVIGVVYTMFSEWLNITVRGAWAYSDLMPIIPFIGTGVTPLLQWLLLPVAAYLLATRNIAAAVSPFARHTVS